MTTAVETEAPTRLEVCTKYTVSLLEHKLKRFWKFSKKRQSRVYFNQKFISNI